MSTTPVATIPNDEQREAREEVGHLLSLLDEDERALDFLLPILHTWAGSAWSDADGVTTLAREDVADALNYWLPVEDEEDEG